MRVVKSNFKKNGFVLILTIIAIIVVFVFDVSMPLGVAGGVPYVLPILILGNHSYYRWIWGLAIVTSILVGLGYLLSPDGGELWKVLTNRFLAVFVIWITTVLLHSSKKNAERRLETQKKLIENHKQQSIEREILLQEIHHRVKNNLQITASLLSLQSGYIDDEKAKNALQASNRRINSMALVHEKLYQTKDFSKINYGNYLKELVRSIINSLQSEKEEIEVKYDMPELFLNIDTAVPLGLLINELVTNSVKHGFYERVSNVLEIKIVQMDDSNFQLLIGDNGVGFDYSSLSNRSKSLGLVLIKSMVKQLKGNLQKVDVKSGTEYIINFQRIGGNREVKMVG